MRLKTNGIYIALLSAAICWIQPCRAGQEIDVVSYFRQAREAGRDGLVRKTRPVDVRAARPGEVIVTTIKGEGRETSSPPAKPGDMVVRNRCPASGNEEFLVQAATFAKRYEGPIGPAAADGWQPYRPKGIGMRFVIVSDADGAFTFVAPWKETMVARPGDAIVQSIDNPANTYRVQKAAFACTYEVVEKPSR